MRKLLLLLVSVSIPLISFSQDAFEDDFNDNTLTGWQGNSTYSLTEENGELTAEVDKTGGWAAFELVFPEPLDLTLTPYIVLKVKASPDVNLRIDFEDSDGRITNQLPVVNSIERTSYTTFTYNFDGRMYQGYDNTGSPVSEEVNSESLAKVLLIANPGGDYTGTITIDDVLVGTATGMEPVQPPEPHIALNQIGFYPEEDKVAVVTGDHEDDIFYIVSAETEDTVYTGTLTTGKYFVFSRENARIADFSELDTTKGKFQLLYDPIGLSHEFEIKENVHLEALKGTLKSYYYQRSDQELLPEHAGQWARAAGPADLEVKVHSSANSDQTTVSTPGGWFDAGDYGKYTVNAGITTYQLLTLYEHYPSFYDTLNLNIPESNNQVPDILDEVLYNLRWMLSMQDTDGGVFHKNTALRHDRNVMPDEANTDRYVIGKSTAAALNLAAVAAHAYPIFKKFEDQYPRLADSLITAAVRAYDWAEANPEEYFNNNPTGVNTGAYGDREDVEDEFMWAKAELLSTTRLNKYVDENVTDQDFGIPGYNQVDFLGLFTLLNNRNSISDFYSVTSLRNALTGSASWLAGYPSESPYQTVMGNEDWMYNWGSNAGAANQAVILIQAYRLTGRKSYFDAALTNLDYLLGRNATGYSFLTGFGDVYPMDLHHRPSYVDGIEEPVPGFIVGGPHADVDGGENCGEYPYSTPANRYLDEWCSYSTNENAINYNSGFTYLVGAIEALRAGADFVPDRTEPPYVGTKDVLTKEMVSVFPNPALDHVYINSSKDLDATVSVSDLSGRQVISNVSVNLKQGVVDVSKLENGIYILTIQGNNSSFSEKIIIK